MGFVKDTTRSHSMVGGIWKKNTHPGFERENFIFMSQSLTISSNVGNSKLLLLSIAVAVHTPHPATRSRVIRNSVLGMEKGLKSCGWENIKILKLLDALFPDFFVKIGKMMNKSEN